MSIIECERYEIEPMPIGRGGFGEVYKAYDLLYENVNNIFNCMIDAGFQAKFQQNSN